MREKTIKKLNINGNIVEIYQFRILLNGNKCRFLGYTVNGEDRKGCFLLKEISVMIDYIRLEECKNNDNKRS